MADEQIRLAAFEFLDRERALTEDGRVSWLRLTRGFVHEGQRITLAGPPGIWKPAGMRLPLSFRTTPPKDLEPPPYDDRPGPDGLLHYRYFGKNPLHFHNRGMQSAMMARVPMIYLWGVEKGVYYAEYPVRIVGDEPEALTFVVDLATATERPKREDNYGGFVAEEQRRYTTSLRYVRLHQKGFRHRVLRAYGEQCAVCALKHRELLDAAHILPDGHPRGEPVVANGISFCMLHHRAYDRDVIGVTPDYAVRIKQRVLEEKDGPMLLHGLQGFQGQSLHVPRKMELQPDRDRLAERYETYLKAG